MNSTVEPFNISDTNALISYLIGSSKLGAKAEQIFRAAEQGETIIYIPAIVMVELYYANKKWRFFEDFMRVYERLKEAVYFRFLPMVSEEVLDFDDLEAMPEMHDRLIAGVARRLEEPLLTNDPQIERSKLVRIVWQ